MKSSFAFARRVALCALFAVSLAHSSVAAEPTSADRILAEQEFRRGVQAYYRGAFNDAVMVFEKALSLIPGEPRILDWLGKAYYRTGVESAALQQWQFASGAGFGGILLKNRMEVVRERRIAREPFDSSSRFVEATQISSKGPNGPLFRQPVSAAALPDGTFWICAYGSNEIVRMDVNGVIVGRSRGPTAGFDRPLDLVRLGNGTMLVTEMAADRVSVLSEDGTWLSSFGKKGRGLGEFVGPQYAARDDSGNIYVTDFGNARVVVFGPDGAPLHAFGAKSPFFPGFVAPGGIAVIGERVFVADMVTGALHTFDRSGNFEETLLPEGTIRQSEALRVWRDGLLVALPTRVAYVDPNTGASYEIASFGKAPSRITGVVPDVNGNLVMTDYKGGFVQLATPMGELVGGLFTQIERVRADSFPRVQLELRVEDRGGNPIVGLKGHNFLVTEGGRPVSDMRLEGAGYLDDSCDVTIILERSPAADRRAADVRAAVSAIAKAMDGRGTLRLVSAGAIPAQEGSGSPETGSWEALRPKTPASSAWAFDLALRLAVNDLVNASRRRAVIFLSSGDVGERGFTKYALNDLAAYMKNNGVAFSVVSLVNAAIADEYAYLAESTGGKGWYVWRNEGLAQAVKEIIASPNGSYLLSYTSALPTDFGKRYLSVETEVYLMTRSGRDETGYYAPLE